jgi:hypothetical protein
MVDTRIKRSLSELGYNIRISHKGRNLGHILHNQTVHPPTRNRRCNILNCKVNSHLCFRAMVVYEAACVRCSAKYIGSTKKFLHTRVKEHFTQTASHIYKHNTICAGLWKFNVKGSFNSIQSMRFAEAILIKQEKPQINARDEGASLMSFLV